jgi:hypothetical protein
MHNPGDIVIGLSMEDCQLGHPEVLKVFDRSDMVGKKFMILNEIVKYDLIHGEMRPYVRLVGHEGQNWCAGCFRKIDGEKLEVEEEEKIVEPV